MVFFSIATPPPPPPAPAPPPFHPSLGSLLIIGTVNFPVQSKSQNNTKNALGVIDKVSGALLKQLEAGGKPKAISSPNLDMSVGRKTLDSIGGADDDEDAEEGEGMGGVRLPNPLGLFGPANASVEEGATSAIGSTVSDEIMFF